MFYRSSNAGTVCVVVGGDLASHFVVTAYLTRTPKKGSDLWTR
jgi:hypothetical protein